jgi:hypothetical protein
VAGKPSLARVRNHVRVVAQSAEPVRVLTGSADPRSHLKIIPTQITNSPPTVTARPMVLPSSMEWMKHPPRQTLPPLNPATVLTSHRALTGQGLSREWRGTEQTMRDQTNQTDPTEQYDQPEHTDEQQPHPGLTYTMQDQPDHGEDSYRGSSRLTGKRAVITGADSGIGRAVALAFAREGADVVLSYLGAEEADADETVSLVEAEGRKAIRCPGDIRSEETCQKIIDTAVEQLGGIDVLVNNAAYQMAQMGGIADITTEQFDQVMKTNLYAMFWLCKKAIPYMEAGATIINTSSVQAVNPSPELLDYPPPKPESTTSPRPSRRSWRRRASG